MVGWHHRLYGHEFEKAPGISDGQESLACCTPSGCKELDMTERLNSAYLNATSVLLIGLQYGFSKDQENSSLQRRWPAGVSSLPVPEKNPEGLFN